MCHHLLHINSNIYLFIFVFLFFYLYIYLHNIHQITVILTYAYVSDTSSIFPVEWHTIHGTPVINDYF